MQFISFFYHGVKSICNVAKIRLWALFTKQFWTKEIIRKILYITKGNVIIFSFYQFREMAESVMQNVRWWSFRRPTSNVFPRSIYLFKTLLYFYKRFRSTFLGSKKKELYGYVQHSKVSFCNIIKTAEYICQISVPKSSTQFGLPCTGLFTFARFNRVRLKNLIWQNRIYNEYSSKYMRSFVIIYYITFFSSLQFTQIEVKTMYPQNSRINYLQKFSPMTLKDSNINIVVVVDYVVIMFTNNLQHKI